MRIRLKSLGEIPKQDPMTQPLPTSTEAGGDDEVLRVNYPTLQINSDQIDNLHMCQLGQELKLFAVCEISEITQGKSYDNPEGMRATVKIKKIGVLPNPKPMTIEDATDEARVKLHSRTVNQYDESMDMDF